MRHDSALLGEGALSKRDFSVARPMGHLEIGERASLMMAMIWSEACMPTRC
jgi:hypothetical protein